MPMTDVEKAFEVVVRFRAAHEYPLMKATNGLRSVVHTVGCEAKVSQRLKRIPTIIDKLRRHAGMELGRMQDIGGCRALLTSIADLRLVESRLRKNHPSGRSYDYIASPRESGYRAVHVVVSYKDRQGVRRPIEVQLRTWGMHEWAYTVERLSSRSAIDLKSGEGPAEVQAWLQAISGAMALEEAGGTVSKEEQDRITRLRGATVDFLNRGASG